MIAIGVGCRRGCPAEDIVALIERACAQVAAAPGVLATSEIKCHEAGIREAAARLRLSLAFVAEGAIAAAQGRCATQSARGIPSVAEAAALVAAGPGSRLLLARIATPLATCALAAG